MFCPQCATANADGAKFCRSCGQELETLALALSGVLARPAEAGGEKDERREWLVRRGKSVKDIAGGVVLMLVSVLMGFALALFAPADVPWMLLWVGLFGWMAVWGGIELASAVGRLLEAKGRLRLLELEAEGPAALPPRRASPAAGSLTDPTPALKLSPPASVTEGTTRSLDERVEH